MPRSPTAATSEPSSSDAGPDAFLPLTPAVFEILTALVGTPLHGYAILQAVNTAGPSRELLPGTLYRALSRLVDTGLLNEESSRPEPEDDDERRRYYALTPLGRSVLSAEARRLARQVEVARSHGLLSDGEPG